MKIDILEIIEKHKPLINYATDQMMTVKDAEHGLDHVNYVVNYTIDIIDNVGVEFDPEVCIISAFWHDVGRIISNENHEQISANMLRDKMKELNYQEDFIDKCYSAIVNHSWNMDPKTVEGKIIKDADKIAFIGLSRWKRCIDEDKRLDDIIQLLPKLRNEILYFHCSKSIYDKEIVELIEYLHNEIFKLKLNNKDVL